MSDQAANLNHGRADTKTLTNIYYDCLERIFDYLNITDLLNIAQTCKRLQIAAAAKFGDDFSKKANFVTRLYHSKSRFIRYEPGISINGTSIAVVGLRHVLPFMRCFGSKLSHLWVYYLKANDADSQNDRINQYISQYCSDTLDNITLIDKPFVSIESFSKPFKNVKKVSISSCDLGNQLRYFLNWFPNLRHLDITSVTIGETDVTVNIPYLETLSIWIGEQSITYEQAEKLLHANQQLKKLAIDSIPLMALDKLFNMISANPSLSKLNVYGLIEYVDVVELNPFIGEYPLLIEELRLGIYRLTPEVAMIIINKLKSLKSFLFRVKDRSDCDRFLNQLDNKWQHNVEERRMWVELKSV